MATWGQRRQFIIIGIIAAACIVLLGIIAALIFYKPASCVDGKQNQKEEGIDCGGPCPYLCSASQIQPAALFVTPFSPEDGRTDVIAYIANRNTDTGVMHAHYTVELRDPFGAVLGDLTGTINLPPASTVPLFIPHAYQGNRTVAQAFLTFDPESMVWPRNYQKPVVPTPSSIQILDSTSNAPKISALLTNPTAHAMYDVTVVVTAFDAKNNAIAASQTVVPTLPAQGSAPLIFTWNEAFKAAPVSVQILPASGS